MPAVLSGNVHKYDKLPSGLYVKTQLLVNKKESHSKKFKKLRINNRAMTYVDLEDKGDYEAVVFYTAIPEFIDTASIQAASIQKTFYLDILDLKFSGAARDALAYIEPKFPVDDLPEKSDATWVYPEKVLDDVIYAVTYLSEHGFLLEGFEEALLVGPEFKEV